MSIKRPTIALIGGGMIGSTIAHLAMLKNLGNVVIFDVVEGMPQGKQLDLSHCTPVEARDGKVKGTNSYEGIRNADCVVVTAGVARKPGMSRDDLTAINSKIIRQVGENIKQYCPNAFIIVVTNPLDSMVKLLHETVGCPSHRIVGMAGVLDSSRFNYFLAERLNVSVSNIQSLVLGGHGDTMCVFPRYVSVSGISLDELIRKKMISEKEVNDIIARTANAGGEVVSLLKNGSAYYSPATSVVEMLESYIMNKRKILCSACYLDGEYNIKGYFIGVPCIIGERGIEKIIQLDLNDLESKKFLASYQAVKKIADAKL